MSDAIQPWPVVKAGAQGHPILTLQELLRAHGHAIAVDGVFGPATTGAVKAVQTAAGLAADGIAGPLTWPKAIVQVQAGATGDAVRGVQVELQFRDGSGDPSSGLAVDGIFGEQTTQAVLGFQKALHQDAASVAVDGIVGPVTWRALVSGMLSF